jgi:Domain of unknown function (DUF6898)
MGTGSQKPEIYIECIVHGGLMKVTAIDSATGTEASVFGPATAPREALQHNAVAKLAYVMKKRANRD